MPSIDRYVTPLKLPMAIDAFWRFPHLAAYTAEYLEGNAVLTYRPRLSMARLRVAPRAERAIADVNIVPLDVATARTALAKLFLAAFARVPPMDAMPATTRRHAADAALKHTASGGDGDVISVASFAAMDAVDGDFIGAAIVTRIHSRQDEWPDAELPPVLLNLTWLFVAPQRQRQQIASALVDRVVNAISPRDVPWLVSHFSIDNPPAVMWHWRNGFEVVPGVR